MNLHYSIIEHNKTVQILRVSNLLNELDNRAILRDVNDRIANGNVNFVLDLSNSVFLNSVGINFLILMLKRAQNSGGNLLLANASKHVLNLLDITKLRPFFKLTSSVDEALRNFEVRAMA